MTPIASLSPFELAAINTARREEHKPPLGSLRTVQDAKSLGTQHPYKANAVPFVQTIIGQDFAPPPGGERRFEISIKDLATAKPPPPGVGPAPSQPQEGPRWTQPQPPAQPSSFAQSVNAAITRNLGKRRYSKPSEPAGEPSTFAEQLAAATRKRRRG
jgi:hypothetical protein